MVGKVFHTVGNLEMWRYIHRFWLEISLRLSKTNEKWKVRTNGVINLLNNYYNFLIFSDFVSGSKVRLKIKDLELST